MRTLTVKPRDTNLRKYIQYFLFFKNDTPEPSFYRTFPNTNLCLALYKQNQLLIHSSKNNCLLQTNGPTYVSKLWGFHSNPFEVHISSLLDQVCILFHPGALRAFTTIEYKTLMPDQNVFETVFGKSSRFIIEQVFETDTMIQRACILETFLLQQLKLSADPLILEALQQIHEYEGCITVETLAKKLHISLSTLYRIFTQQVGQAPKKFADTVRFRKALDLLTQTPKCLQTGLSYELDYYDQSHFVNNFKKYSGFHPSLFLKLYTIEKELIWVYQKQTE